MKEFSKTIKDLKHFLVLWSTQAFSSLGSAMTNFALVIWLYESTGSALSTALLSVCSYAPYVVMSIFAGAISDRWNKKTVMLVCDCFAAVCTVTVFLLLKTDRLEAWHLYTLNALNGLMNTVQSPASDVAATLLTPKKYFQRTSGMRSFSNSVVSILTPVLATAVVALAGVEAVLFFDLFTFAAAFLVLLFFIRIPGAAGKAEKNDGVLSAASAGLAYLRTNKGILWIMLFLAAINFIASMYNAALPAMVLSKADETALGAVSTCVGLATLAGSLLATLLPAPKNRIRVFFACMFVSMSTENFLLALGKTPLVWCLGAVLGWLFIPLMNACYDVIFRTSVPVDMQGRVYSARNTLQFFTIPLGYLVGGVLVDRLFEPLMNNAGGLPALLFGSGKGAGAAALFFIMGLAGVAVCLFFSRSKHIWALEKQENRLN